MKKVFLLLFAGLLLGTPAAAQQDPLYAQYMNNPFLINPAYAGYANVLTTAVQYRSQWAQFEGHPVTAALTGHMPVVENRMALGMHVIQDRIGDSENFQINGAYAYQLHFSASTLSFGLQAGMIQYANNPEDLNIQDPDDPAFFPYTEMQFNTGVGLMLFGEKFAVGASIPRLLPATVSQGGESIELYSQNIYVMGSYLLFLSDNIRLKPSTLLRYTAGNPVSVDLNANLTYLDAYSAGVFTRNFNTYGVQLNFHKGKFSFGYTLEVPTNKSIGAQFVSHELMLALRLKALHFHDAGTVKNF